MSRPRNVLWLMMDEQRTDSLGCYGSPWARTPVIDQLAAEGTRFVNAVTPSPVCVPARSSLLTGRYPNETGVWGNASGLPQQVMPLTWHFERAGYRTGSFGKHHYLASSMPAFQTQVNLVLSDEVGYFAYASRWDPDDYDVVQYDGPIPWILAGRFPADAAATAEAQAVVEAKRWLEAMPKETPFFLRLSFNGPHTPVVPPAPFDTCISPDDIDLSTAIETLPADSPEWLHDVASVASAARLRGGELRRLRQAYYGEVAYLDTLVGDLLTWMETRGLLDDLVVVFCSDHGTHLGDFGLVQKCTFFDSVVNVPYFFWAPGIVKPARAVETPVEVRTIIPTLLELTGLEVPGDLPRASLAPFLERGAEPPLAPVYSEFTWDIGSGDRRKRRLVMVREGCWKLSTPLDPEPSGVMLTNLSEDPGERVNLAKDPKAAKLSERLLGLAEAHTANIDANSQ